MNPQEDYKRKYSGLLTYKNPAVSNVVKERKKTDVSREKDDKKIHHPTVGVHSKLLGQGQAQDENAKTNSKMLNFRNLKDTLPKKQAHPPKKSTIKTNINPSEYFQKGLKPSQSPTQGISINVNIQNMLPSRTNNLTPSEQFEQKSDRSQLGEDKKPKKVPLINPIKNIEDLECTEQLNFKKPLAEATRNKFQDKIEKTALIDRKSHRIDIHTKLKQKASNPQSQFKEAMKKFEAQAEAINSSAQAETFSYLDFRQSQYMVPPDYIEKCQKHFNWTMRSTLFEWIMHVSYEFSMKRETYYIAINLIDSFMSKEHHLAKSEFQLVGAASMFIASKLEEFEPKCSEEFARATIKYNATQIKEMERKILKVLKYNLNPPTLYMWANRLMLQWDTFLEVNCYAQRHPVFATCEPKFFKKNTDESYRTFRVMMQLIDCSVLDIQTVQYKPKLLVCAFMYLVMGKQMGIFKTKEITHDFPRSSLYLLDEDNLFNDLFMNFLNESFNIALIDLLPTVQYTATYFILPMSYDDPITPTLEEGEMNFEDYCSFQTHNPHLLAVIKKRFRGIYE